MINQPLVGRISTSTNALYLLFNRHQPLLNRLTRAYITTLWYRYQSILKLALHENSTLLLLEWLKCNQQQCNDAMIIGRKEYKCENWFKRYPSIIPFPTTQLWELFLITSSFSVLLCYIIILLARFIWNRCKIIQTNLYYSLRELQQHVPLLFFGIYIRCNKHMRNVFYWYLLYLAIQSSMRWIKKELIVEQY